MHLPVFLPGRVRKKGNNKPFAGGFQRQVQWRTVRRIRTLVIVYYRRVPADLRLGNRGFQDSSVSRRHSRSAISDDAGSQDYSGWIPQASERESKKNQIGVFSMANAKVIIAGQNNIGPAVKSAQGDISSLANVAQKAGAALKSASLILISLSLIWQ